MKRRGFSLLETLAVMVVLAIAVPPASMMLADAGRARRDAVMMARATWLATGVLEHVLADVNSPAAGLGFDALDDSATYLDDATTGLYARLDSMMSFYDALGLSATVTIGPLADASGAVTGDADQDLFRTITVNVSWTDSKGEARTLALASQATEL